MNMTGLDFYTINNPDEIQEALEPITIGLLRAGYQNIPDWKELSDQMKFLIRKYGWRDKNIFDIAEQAGKSLGMKKFR